MKINCLNQISKVGTDNLTSDYSMTDNVAEADAILVRSAAMKEMEFSSNLKAIARAGAGVNNIPLDKCAEQGIVVFNTPGANANSVKEIVLCGMLMASRDIVGGVEWIQTIGDQPTIAKDVEKGKKAFAGNEIKGKTLGVIGLGAVGAEVANAAAALGMNVLGYDPYISVNAAWRLSRKIKHVTDVSDIYSNSDYITMHVPLTDENEGMINAETISKMKDGVVLLNFSRDLLVEDDDMAAALMSGKIRKYVTDFPNVKTAKMKGCMAIPHLGASTEEAEDNCAVMAVDELMDYLANGNIKNSVNYPACDMGECKSESRVAVLHKNIPNMIGQITAVLAGDGVNITDLTNKSRGDYAYTLIDLGSSIGSGCIDELGKIDGVIKVRKIK